MKFGIIREGKTPPDARVPLTPQQVKYLREKGRFQWEVQSSAVRCFRDEEYLACGIHPRKELHDCEVLLGVKEVPIEQLIPQKTYCFFSHTIKAQPYNQKLLRSVLEKRIRLIDYEVLTDAKGRRLIAFGRFAGMVGAHNALWTFGKRSGLYSLPRMKDCRDYAEAKAMYQNIKWPAVKIVLTGSGRVGNGAAEVLEDMGIRRVGPSEFLQEQFSEAVFTQLDPKHYVGLQGGISFSDKDFFNDPAAFHSTFGPFTEEADIMINGIFWDPKAPAFFSTKDMKGSNWSIQVIADVTCDIAPEASIPSTLRASTIDDPVFGYDPFQATETPPYLRTGIDVMSIDNLPNEMPRDASKSFGEQFIENILPEFSKSDSPVLDRATIACDGKLGRHFQYLEDYVKS